MGVFDLVIVGLLALFAGIGALRGSLRELLSLGVWLLALASGWLFADAVGTWFEAIEDTELRRLLAFLAIVVAMLAFLSLAAFVLRQLLPRPAPSLANRVGGALLGALRGGALVVVLVLLAGLTSLPNKDGWRDSPLVGVFQPAARTVLDWLPTTVARQFRYG
jgi:membrane protein required for colicin V production